ncbi:MAG: hypothetical protein HY720_27470 [Planctomycetes bacterium]|nr:hypothetical protein [Planctomycetota bacterium]
MIHFSCPACGKHLKAGPSHVGRTTTCPGCQASVTVPDQPSESAVPEMPAAPTAEAAAPIGVLPEWAVEPPVVLGAADDLGYLGQESSVEIEAIRDPISPGAPPPLPGIPRSPSRRRAGSGSRRSPDVPGRSSGPRPAGRSSSSARNRRRSRQRVLVLGAALGCAFVVAGFFLLVLFAGGEKGAVEPPAPLSSPPPSVAPAEPEDPAVEAARLAGSYRFADAARTLERARSGSDGSHAELARLEERMEALDQVFAALVSALSRDAGAGGTRFERPGRGMVRILRADAEGIEYEETSLVEDARKVSKTWDSLSPSFVLLLMRAVGLETRDPAGVEAFARYFALGAPIASGSGAPERSSGPADGSWEEFMVKLGGMLRWTLEGSKPEGLLALAERSLTEDLRSRLDRELREASFASGNRVAQLAADPLWHGIVGVGGYDLLLREIDRRRDSLGKSPEWQSLRSGIGEARARAAAYASAERRALGALDAGDLDGARSEFSSGSYAGDPWFQATIRFLDRPEIASLFGSGGGRLAAGSSGRGEGSGKAGDGSGDPAGRDPGGRAGPEPGAAEETPGRGRDSSGRGDSAPQAEYRRDLVLVPRRGEAYRAVLLTTGAGGVRVLREGSPELIPWADLSPYTIARIRSLPPFDPRELIEHCRAEEVFDIARSAWMSVEGPEAVAALSELRVSEANALVENGADLSPIQLGKAIEARLERQGKAGLETRSRAAAEALAAKRVGNIVSLVTQGDVAKRFDIVCVGCGWDESEQERFDEECDAISKNIVQVEPFANYRSYINVHRVNVLDRGSGLNGSNLLGARIDGDALTCDRGKAWEYARLGPDADLVVVVVNVQNLRSTGGAGVLTLDASGDITEVAMHELGHALGDLDDEYVDPGTAPRFPDYGPAQEPDHVNTTREADPRKCKWHYWLLPPMAPGVGCTEGAYYRASGYFRPSLACRMLTSSDPYCAVCFEQMEKSLYQFVDPIDRATPYADSLRFFRRQHVQFLVEAVVTQGKAANLGVLHASWYVDGTPVDAHRNEGRTTLLEAHTLDLLPGEHEIAVRVDFENKRVRRDDGLLSGTRVWRVHILPYAEPKVAFQGDAPVAAGTDVEVTAALDSASCVDGLSLVVQELPPGALFDPPSGRLTWKTREIHRGAHIFRVGIVDREGNLLGTRETVLEVLPAEGRNAAPVLLVPDELRVAEGEVFYYRVRAFDPDGDRLVYSAVGLPEGAHLDAASGEILWPVSFSQGGTEIILALAVRDWGRPVTKRVRLVVENRRVASASRLVGFDIVTALRDPSVIVQSSAIDRLVVYPETFQLLEFLRLLRARTDSTWRSALGQLDALLAAAGERKQALLAMACRDVARHLWHFTDRPEVLAWLANLARDAEVAGVDRGVWSPIHATLGRIAAYNRSREN